MTQLPSNLPQASLPMAKPRAPVRTLVDFPNPENNRQQGKGGEPRPIPDQLLIEQDLPVRPPVPAILGEASKAAPSLASPPAFMPQPDGGLSGEPITVEQATLPISALEFEVEQRRGEPLSKAPPGSRKASPMNHEPPRSPFFAVRPGSANRPSGDMKPDTQNSLLRVNEGLQVAQPRLKPESANPPLPAKDAVVTAHRLVADDGLAAKLELLQTDARGLVQARLPSGLSMRQMNASSNSAHSRARPNVQPDGPIQVPKGGTAESNGVITSRLVVDGEKVDATNIKVTVLHQETHFEAPRRLSPHLGDLQIGRSARSSSRATAATNISLQSVNGLSNSSVPIKIMNLRLDPATLGSVVVKLRLKGDTMTVHIQPMLAQTAAMLRNDSSALNAILQAAGPLPEAVSVQIQDPDSSSSGPRGLHSAHEQGSRNSGSAQQGDADAGHNDAVVSSGEHDEAGQDANDEPGTGALPGGSDELYL